MAVVAVVMVVSVVGDDLGGDGIRHSDGGGDSCGGDAGDRGNDSGSGRSCVDIGRGGDSDSDDVVMMGMAVVLMMVVVLVMVMMLVHREDHVN